MSELKGEFATAAIEDARARHSAIIELIRFTDQQAITLLSFYATLATACASGAAASLGANAALPVAVGGSLLAAAAMFLAGAACCFRVLASATVNLPGREPEFWLSTTLSPTVPDEPAVYKAYLEELGRKSLMNGHVNATGALWLGRARLLGILAPLAAGGVAILAGLFL